MNSFSFKRGKILTKSLTSQGFTDLLGSVGGILGLWIGASIFTLIEFVWNFFAFLITFIKIAKNKFK